MKGTQLWQGIGSPLIEGRSRQLPPFWRAWADAAVLSAVGVSLGAWMLYGVRGADLCAVASAVGAAAGVSVARRFEWRPSWPLGAALGAAASLAYLVVAARFWPVLVVAVNSHP